MSDLVSGRYGAREPFFQILGQPANASQGDIPVRSNFIINGPSGLVDLGEPTTKKGRFAAIPVQEGDYITKIGWLQGETSGASLKSSFVSVYSGIAAPKLISSGAKETTAAYTKEKPFSQELTKGVLCNSETAPNGYLWVGLTIEAAATVGSVFGWKIKPKAQFAYFTNSPAAYATETTQKAEGEAEAALTVSAIEAVPAYFLS